jgi:hypothetical protein
MARSGCSFQVSTLIRSGSLKVGSINTFLGCWHTNTEMIVADGLLLECWIRMLDTIVCLEPLVWLFSLARDAVKLTLESPGRWIHLPFRGHRPFR